MRELTDKQLKRCMLVSASVDRITPEGGAVVILEAENGSMVVEVEPEVVPENVKEGDWVTTWVIGRWVKKMELDEERTKQEEGKAKEIRDKLRKTTKGSRFKRKE